MLDDPADPADPDVATVLNCYAAFARGDIAEAVAPMAADVVWIEPDEFPNGGERRGPAAVADYLSASRAGWEQLTSVATPYRHGTDIVIVHQLDGVLVGGTPHQARVADVFTVVDGSVIRMRAYADPADAFRTR
jgi:ketosteroid isomerase-like protein